LRGKRKLLADILFDTGLIGPISRFMSNNKLIIFNYHRIKSDTPGVTSDFDDGVYNLNADMFYRQMKWMKQHTRIVSEADLIGDAAKSLNTNKKLTRPLVAITFDDGYRDNYDIAYPILKSLQIPAFFFICTEMIWERQLRWWDILAYLIKKCEKPSIVINETEYPLETERSSIIADFLQQLKPYPLSQIQDYLQLISNACEVNFPSNDVQDNELMTLEQICEMQKAGMIIGSHTHTHQAMSAMNHDIIHQELTISKRLLEETTGQPVRSVSYPYGRYQYIPLSVQNTARKCGYQLGFTSSSGVNYLNELHPMVLNRFSCNLEQISTAALTAAWPDLFAIREESQMFHRRYIA